MELVSRFKNYKKEPGLIALGGLFGAYCYLYLFSLFLQATDQVPPGTEWMASLVLVIEGLAAACWVGVNYGARRAWAAALVMLAGGFLVETAGSLTGFPFGRYSYTPVLYPKLLVVPVGIGFAWLMTILASFFCARFLLGRLKFRGRLALLIFLSGGLATASDLLMEPVAVYLQNYWNWQDKGQYYGVPLSNFLAWWVFSSLMSLLLRSILEKPPSRSPEKFRFGFIPILLFTMNLFLFATVNLTHGFYLAAGIGLGLLVLSGLAIIFRLSRGER